MRHTHKSGAWFELPEDISQKQLETYERVVAESVGNDKRTDARLARAAVEAAFEAGFLKPGDGCPANAKALADFSSSKILYWMATKISEFLVGLKQVDPN